MTGSRRSNADAMTEVARSGAGMAHKGEHKHDARLNTWTRKVDAHADVFCVLAVRAAATSSGFSTKRHRDRMLLDADPLAFLLWLGPLKISNDQSMYYLAYYPLSQSQSQSQS